VSKRGNEKRKNHEHRTNIIYGDLNHNDRFASNAHQQQKSQPKTKQSSAKTRKRVASKAKGLGCAANLPDYSPLVTLLSMMRPPSYPT
jgi:hypothetical protein